MNKFAKEIRILNDISNCTKEPVYIGTNENIIKIPKTNTNGNRKIHIGVSGWYNFDIILQTLPDQCLIIDRNFHQVKFMKHTISMIHDNLDKYSFISSIINYIKSANDEYQTKSHENIYEKMFFWLNISNYNDYLESDKLYDLSNEVNDVEFQIICELNKPNCWLHNYDLIRKYVLDDKVVIICQNLTNYLVMSNLSKIIKNNHYIVDTIYISNVHDYSDDKIIFIKCIQILAINETRIIWCRSRILQQYITSFQVYTQQILNNIDDDDVNTNCLIL